MTDLCPVGGSEARPAARGHLAGVGMDVRWKMVAVGDSQCGKSALLNVFAKDRFPESYVPTVFENYTATFDLDVQRAELRLWDTSGSSFYDNVRPLSYPDADAVLICFDISRPETLDNVLKKWRGEVEKFCPNSKMLLVGCKSDLRTDLFTRSQSRHTAVSYDQGSITAKQLNTPYLECSSLQSESSVKDIFHVATLACVNKNNKSTKRRKSSRATKSMSHSGRDMSPVVSTHYHQTKAKTCVVM
uniref:Rho-related GTP-binding protein RhoE n=1 Tax=Scophthalmus maximus TaxID=52904 RepID=A0A8D3C3Y8_SCOMX